MPLDTLAPLLNDHLHGQGRLRVWSLIVTFLGDAIEPRGGSVQTARITALMRRLGISGPAQRTALSRLVADGWVERRRDPGDGRASVYRFSDRGRAEFGPAARLVYAPVGSVTGGQWIVTQSDDPRGIMIGPGVGIWPAQFAPRSLGVTLFGTIEHVPDAFSERALGPDQAAEAAALRDLTGFIHRTATPDPLDAMAARTVLIHRWRRYVLRYPEWPDAIAPRDWPGLELRANVARAYFDTQANSEIWLSRPGPGYVGLPRGTAGERFRRS